MKMSSKPTVFVITPFADNFLALYDALKERFSESFEFTNAGDLDNQQNILKDIVVGIHSADVIVADLTGLNPNVFYELGLAHAMDKKVIIITQDIDELPFDIKSYRANSYSLLFHKIPQLYTKLEELLTGAVNGNKQFGSPYSDFIKNTTVQKKEIIASVEVTSNNSGFDEDVDENEAKGFLDFVADIEEAMNKMTTEISGIQLGMEEMTAEVENATNEIDRVKRTGGDSSATFARNVARKLSQPVNTFATKLKNHVLAISDNWNAVENNYLAVLDNNRIYTKDNLEGVGETIKCLSEMQTTIYDTNDTIEGFIDSLKISLGFERRFTKSITMLITELQEYLTMTNMMDSSIERIIAKSKTLNLPDEETNT